LTLSSIDEDALGEQIEVIWEIEPGAHIIEKAGLPTISGQDETQKLEAFLDAVRWGAATNADRGFLQAPFRSGVSIEDFQLDPLVRAIDMARANLLIADDVGLGKTIEAGLILRELLLRRRVDLIVVAAPPSMLLQWQDELWTRFGLRFAILDREFVTNMRRERGFGVNPWDTDSRFLISHRLLIDETYAAGLHMRLGDFRPRSLLILDEAHHAAPASGRKYAVDSQITLAIRELAPRSEHRLFLTATPHNGHPNSFAALMHILDPQRFVRGMDIEPAHLEPVMGAPPQGRSSWPGPAIF
jgi:SNF2 family DNA or RNA helicase